MKTNHRTYIVALSAQLVELGDTAPTEIKLVPDGAFRSARDARPEGIPGWLMDGDSATAILSAQSALKSRFLIDYDHQTLRSEKNGLPAPAAGWGARFDWRPGDGLYAVEIDWNAAALSAIAAKEYRYISPVIRYDGKTGRVTGVPMAALTNFPAIDDLNDLAAAAALLFSTEDNGFDMKQLLAKLGLPDDADEAAALSAVDALLAAAVQANEQLAVLSATPSCEPDPALFVPRAVVDELRGKLASLSATTVDDSIEKLVEKGMADGRILGEAEKAWAVTLGKSNLALLQGYLDSAQPIAALSGMQSQVKPPVEHSALTGEAKARHQFEQSAALQAEFGSVDTYVAYFVANESGSVKVLGSKE
ncbi:MAG: hypothetical protein EPN89_06065 [Methylovulum sp.]|nr:MAG: hypothetical protein EPN89_06065 [Methylovulum sp.]